MRLPVTEARRIALRAQGFDRARPQLDRAQRPPIGLCAPKRRVTAADLKRVIRQLGLVQIDYVNVLVPAQYQIPFSRCGPYERALLDDVAYRSREFTEQWAHEASIIPVETWPLLRERMKTRRFRPWGFEKLLDDFPAYFDFVLQQVRERGPIAAEELPLPDKGPRRIPGAWHGSVARATLEAHFARGTLSVAARRSDFSRLYDLTERIVPEAHHSRMVEAADAERELIRLAAKSQGIGTATDLADYYRSNIRDARVRIAELVEAGDLIPVEVEGWREPAYLSKDAKPPKAINVATLLSPFDPMVWFRPRALRLFDFDYRIEIWFSESQRKWGYYVLPFLLDDRLVARVDLKADRAARSLLVVAAYIEPHADEEQVAPALATELRTWADWLHLERVAVAKKGNLGRRLNAELHK
jgi:uncharacterized protein